MKVIIIAAGMGRRLNPLTEDRPKCLLEVAGKTILERKLEILRSLMLEEIALIRGYRKELFNFPDLTYFENDDYESNNILHSLFCAKEFMDEAFIATYSDILYERAVPEKLLASTADFSVVVDTRWADAYVGRSEHPITEAELVAVDGEEKVARIGKGVVSPEEAYGEFIGMVKFSDRGAAVVTSEFERLVDEYRQKENQSFQNAKEFRKAYLTDMLQELIDHGYEVRSVPIEGGWTEIDTDQDLERAHAFWNSRDSK